MVRAAAKNYAHVGIVTSPADYPVVLDELRPHGSLSAATRRRLARAAFAHTAAYDAAIVAWLDAGTRSGHRAHEVDAERPCCPPTLHLTSERTEVLRYGENPHQRGARYRMAGSAELVGRRRPARRHAALVPQPLRRRRGLAAGARAGGRRRPGTGAVAIIKHANPCGAAVAGDLVDGLRAGARVRPASRPSAASWPSAATVTPRWPTAIAAGPQADVIIAPSYDPEALETSCRPGARPPGCCPARPPSRRCASCAASGPACWSRTPTRFVAPRTEWRVVTKRPPTDDEWRDLVLAWRVCGRTTSNAIAVVTDGQAVGVGAGQQSRVVAAEIAVQQGGGAGQGWRRGQRRLLPLPRRALVLAEAGVTAVAQPGGRCKDDEVIAAADEAGLAMVMTGERHFRH